MARRIGWGLPSVLILTLATGLAGGALIGRWLRKDGPPPEAATVDAAPSPAFAPAMDPTPEAVAPIRPAPVQRLSSLPPVGASLLLAHLYSWSGAPELSAEQATAIAALGQCAMLRRAAPAEHDLLLATARTRAADLATQRRARASVSLPVGADGRLQLPALAEPLRLRVAVTPEPACVALYAATGQPLFFDLRVAGPAPWPPEFVLAAAGPPTGRVLYGDLAIDLGDPVALDAPGGVALSAQAVALYLWSDERRTTPVAALGLADPNSQDAPAAGPFETAPEAAPQGGKPVSADLARRAAQTSGVQLPPISVAPRQAVETHPLPPPLTVR